MFFECQLGLKNLKILKIIYRKKIESLFHLEKIY